MLFLSIGIRLKPGLVQSSSTAQPWWTKIISVYCKLVSTHWIQGPSCEGVVTEGGIVPLSLEGSEDPQGL